MITIKDNEKPEMEVCKMNCDKGLAKHLNKYPMLSHLNKHQMSLFIGRPQSGKTSLIYSLFKGTKKNRILNNVYSTIYLFQPMTSRASMKDNIFEDELPEDQKYDELNFDNLFSVYMRIEKDSEAGYTSAILFDDMGAYLKQKDTLKLFQVMFMNRRHLKLSCYFMCQTYYSFPKDLRRIWTNLFIFKVSKDEMTNIFNELIETKKDILDELLPMVFDEPYKYLMINLDSQKMYKNFDSIVIKEKDK